jgi:integrase/recombinase XerC
MSDLQSIILRWNKNLNCIKALSRNTVIAYQEDLSLFLSFFQKYKGRNISLEDVALLTKTDWISWFIDRKNKNNSVRSIARGLSALKSFFSFLVDNKVIEDHEILTASRPKVSKRLPRPLFIAQINEILHSFEEIKKTNWLVVRDKTIVVLLYATGLRISEALSLNRKDVLCSSCFLHIIGKGGKARIVPILSEMKTIIEKYIAIVPFDLDIEDPLFVNKEGTRLSSSAVQKVMRTSRRLLNLSETVTPHSLRHTYASQIMEQSGDVRGVQELLGHANLSSTQIYTEISKQYITETYDRFHPMSLKKKKIEWAHRRPYTRRSNKPSAEENDQRQKIR